MKTISTIKEMRNVRRRVMGSVGFVPTMGSLHEGHLSLVKKARVENEVVVASIFVNPTQFGPGEDYALYPRDPGRDADLLRRERTDMLFMPSAEEIYPHGFDSWVRVGYVTQRLEGASRPGHFEGVTTVVAKLFNIVKPTRAYFGQKDAQQAIVIKKMVAELNMDLDVAVLPTVREEDGLAMSSRNIYLNPEERRSAPILFKALTLARERFMNGERNADHLRQAMVSFINGNSLANIDYVSIADPYNLEELSMIDCPALASLAVRIGKTRLIDNIRLE
jgi:pantoate--beta-alanine ligase